MKNSCTDKILFPKTNKIIFEKFSDASSNNDTCDQPIKRKCSMDDFVSKRPKLDDSLDEVKHKSRIRKQHILESSDSEDGEMSTEDIKVLEFINTSSTEDLAEIKGYSYSKAQLIVKNRPYISMCDLSRGKITQTHITGCIEIIQIKENVNELLKKCEDLSSSLMEKIEPLLSHVNLDSSGNIDDCVVERPNISNKELKLKPYQLVGINWIRILHEENLNGILADEMGLGKTIQAICFLSYIYEHGFKGPHLIVVPTTTINNWVRELQKWCPELKIIIYQGRQDERRNIRADMTHFKDYNVVLSTYTTAIGNKDDRLFLRKIQFHYAIFDEAHMLKNMMSIRYRYLSNFQIKRKLLLTGTPLQNNLVELISLLSFVMPNMFLSENNGLKKVFHVSQKINSKQFLFNEEKIKQVKEMLTPFCLRRLKSQVLTQLPNKTIDIVYIPLEEEQHIMYNQLIDKTKAEVKELGTSGKFSLGRVMELRKISNHRLLMRGFYTDEMLMKMSKDMLRDDDHITCDPNAIFEDFSVMSDFQIYQTCIQYERVLGKYRFPQELLLQSNKIQYFDTNLPKFIANGDKILVFSQFKIVLDIIQEFLNYRDIKCLRLDGSTSSDDRQVYIDKFNDDLEIKIFLLTTRAGGMGINLTSANVVIINDIDYNPYNDRQAEDRSHRLGQTRDVRVIKLISTGTIDECILHIATEKLKLEQITTNTVDEDEQNGGRKRKTNDDMDDNAESGTETTGSSVSCSDKAGTTKNHTGVNMRQLLQDAIGI